MIKATISGYFETVAVFSDEDEDIADLKLQASFDPLTKKKNPGHKRLTAVQVWDPGLHTNVSVGRLILARMLNISLQEIRGKRLEPHHADFDPLNNQRQNLSLLTHKEHMAIHAKHRRAAKAEVAAAELSKAA